MFLSALLLTVALRCQPTVRVGVATLHQAFPTVLANRPERRVSFVDGYIATVSRDDLGCFFLLTFGGRVYLTVVADYLAPQDRPANQAKRWCIRGRYAGLCPHGAWRWIVDVDQAIWSGLEIPQRAALVAIPANLAPLLRPRARPWWSTPPGWTIRPKHDAAPSVGVCSSLRNASGS